MNGIFYNDIDPKACAWLRELIARGHIAHGIVDSRSIADISPEELREFTQVHFFAGIGGWSLALRWAGWPDDRPVWTGSCPCQPLSCAGQRKGHADERHLWPAFYSLIAECQPPVVFGEQVASKDGREWLAGVRADLEGIGHALGAADLCAAGVGAPHRRQRLFWVADAAGGQCEQRLRPCGDAIQRSADHGATGLVAYAESGRIHRGHDDQASFGVQKKHESDERGETRRLGDTEHHGLPADPQRRGAGQVESESGLREPQGPNPGWPGWGRFETVHCRDGKTRRFEPGSFPLAHGIPGRVGLLRGYGNAIVPQVAAEFIAAYTEIK